MNYRNHPELIERLAAEYVLGTLRGRARSRFQRLMRDDAATRRSVQEWESRLSPMAAAVPDVAPPQRVWDGIRPRIAGSVAARSLWVNLAFWRNLGLAASGCAAALLASIALHQPEVVLVQVPVEKIVEVPSTQHQESYVATLSDKTGRVVAVAFAARNSKELWVRRIDLAPGANQDLELWALPAKKGSAPKSIGLIPASGKGHITLAAVADQSLRDVPALAISLEPAGGSKTGLPTGPVLASGPCLKFW